MLLKATYLRCSDIRQPFPGKSGFHIRGEEERKGPEQDWTAILASKDFAHIRRLGNSSKDKYAALMI